MDRGVISEEEYNTKRKEILDRGNGAIRSLEEQVNSIFSNLEIV